MRTTGGGPGLGGRAAGCREDYTPRSLARGARGNEGQKTHERTKIDTGADLRFVCDDCIGNAVKTAHDTEKKQEGFFGLRFNNEKLELYKL